ncbi:MAG: 3-isopropylmalate dehydratase small subunit [Bacilli bacterium]|nr:3-isopropylmalate dehydratase small subunit [Bacilli bacterium]
MEAFKQHTGLVAALNRMNIDTDAIIPKQFLKRIERTGFGEFLFYEWKFNLDGTTNPQFELNQPRYQGASILLARDNFGCGSSREHAPWAILDYGFRVLIAPSFADIFYNNCFKNGILPIRLDGAAVDDLFKRAEQPGYTLSVDLEKQEITDSTGLRISFDVEDHRRDFLLQGLDDIGLTLKQAAHIDAYETKQPSYYRPKVAQA